MPRVNEKSFQIYFILILYILYFVISNFNDCNFRSEDHIQINKYVYAKSKIGRFKSFTNLYGFMYNWKMAFTLSIFLVTPSTFTKQIHQGKYSCLRKIYWRKQTR